MKDGESIDHRKPQLSETELRFLLNYILGLPVVLGKHRIVASDIPLLAVRSWNVKIRKRAELWIEYEMRRCGMLPKSLREKHGGRPQLDPPQELIRWLPGGKRAA